MDAFADFAWSTVLGAPVSPAAGTTITLALGTGAGFPVAPYYVIAKPPGARPLLSNAEILRVTARTGDVITVTRAQGPSTAKLIAVGWEIYNAITAEFLTELIALLPAKVTETHLYVATPTIGHWLKIAGANVTVLPP